ncbi:hypothetical protein HWV62_10409 [Athelia sp. TMB]|nr:hypothetical protein HWV62_10409 [Athelia sp. TMB]
MKLSLISGSCTLAAPAGKDESAAKGSTSKPAPSTLPTSSRAPPTALSTAISHTPASASSTPIGTHRPTHITHHPPPPHPTLPPPPPPPASPTPAPPSHTLKPVAIVGLVLGALCAAAIAAGLARCYWSWRRTPPQDRVSAALHRYHLQREMEEAAAEPIRARVPRPPPPPYRPPPPGYEAVLAPVAAHVTTPLASDWDGLEHHL